MKERPPFSVLLVAGIISIPSGTLIADMLASAINGDFSFYFSVLIPIALMLGLLKGYEIARGWLMALSGLACLAGVIGLVVVIGRLIFPAPLEDAKATSILEVMAGLAIVGVIFWGAWTPKTRQWCSPSQGPISTRSAVTIFTMFLVAGTTLSLPGKIIEQWEDAPFPVYCRINLQTPSKEAADTSVFNYHSIKATKVSNLPQINMDFSKVDELHKTATLTGVAYSPLHLEFSALGYKKAECTIGNGSPREITLTLLPEKETVRTERKADR